MSRYDPWVNMLRTTVATFARRRRRRRRGDRAPVRQPAREPDAFGRRIARNTSPLLLSESHLGRVADPAGGSYAVEKLTEDLTVAAWEELGRIEAEGPDASRPRIAEVVERRDAAVARRRGRSPGSPSSRTSPRRCRSVARRRATTYAAGARLRGAARRPGHAPGLPGHAWARSPPTPPAPASPPTSSPPAASRSTVAGPTDGVERPARGVRRPAGGLPRRDRPGVRRVGGRPGHRPARRRAPATSSSPARPTSAPTTAAGPGWTRSTSCSRTRGALS